MVEDDDPLWGSRQVCEFLGISLSAWRSRGKRAQRTWHRPSRPEPDDPGDPASGIGPKWHRSTIVRFFTEEVPPPAQGRRTDLDTPCPVCGGEYPPGWLGVHVWTDHDRTLASVAQGAAP